MVVERHTLVQYFLFMKLTLGRKDEDHSYKQKLWQYTPKHVYNYTHTHVYASWIWLNIYDSYNEIMPSMYFQSSTSLLP